MSYASEQRDFADTLQLSLASRGHSVFFDRDDLPEGATFESQIEKGLNESDLFVFLISPDSVKAGRFTLTELKLARAKWPVPDGRVLPVMIVPTPMSDVPAYLKAVTILEPTGSASAETAATVDAMLRARSRKGFGWKLGAGAAAIAAVAAGVYAYTRLGPGPAPETVAGMPRPEAVAACFGQDMFAAIEAGTLSFEQARDLGELCAEKLVPDQGDRNPGEDQRKVFADTFAAAATSSDAKERKAAAAVTKGNVEEGARAFLALARTEADPVAKARNYRSAAALAFQSHPELAVEALEQLVLIAPDDLTSLSALGRVYATLGRTADSERTLAVFSSRAAASGGDWAALAALQDAQRLANTGQTAAAKEKLAASRTLFQQSANQWGIASALATESEMALVSGDLQTAEQFARDALAIATSYKFKDVSANALTLEGRVKLMRFDFSGADAKFVAAEKTFDEIGNPAAKVFVTTQRGFVAMNQQKFAEARQIFEGVREEQEKLQFKEGLAWTDINLAQIAQISGDPEGARQRLLDARRVFKEIGNPVGEAQSLLFEAQIDAALGRTDQALTLMASARAVGEAKGLRPIVAQALISSAFLYRVAGQPERARTDYASALELYIADKNDLQTFWTRDQLGQLALGQNDVAEAKAQWQAAVVLSRKLGIADATQRLEAELAKLN